MLSLAAGAPPVGAGTACSCRSRTKSSQGRTAATPRAAQTSRPKRQLSPRARVSGTVTAAAAEVPTASAME